MPKQKSHKSVLRKNKKSPSSFHSSPTQLRKVSLILISLGFIFFLIPALFYLNQSIQLRYFTPAVKTYPASIEGSLPYHLEIPALKLSLPLIQTKITNNSWEIADNGASYLATSARPGTKGPIVVYGHNTSEIFKSLHKIKRKQSIHVQTKDGKIHTYRVSQILQVNPDKMKIFDVEDETLIIYTCIGFADLQRLVVIAKPAQKTVFE